MTPRARRQARSSRTKPYTKKRLTSPTASAPERDVSQPQPTGPSPTAVAPTTHDRHGYPTQAQFSDILERYMASLHPRKAVKALIDREMYDKIHGTLTNPTDHRIGNAQFRFWVRKMFTLEHVPGYSGPYSESGDPDSPPHVVVHENRPVAIKEDLYSVLCHSHSLAQHGGRDRTCAVVRSLYSYVPKVLIAAFVASCPTCQFRKTGDPIYIPFTEQQPPEKVEPSPPRAQFLPDRKAEKEVVDVEDPGMVYFGPGPVYPFHDGGILMTHPPSHPLFMPPWSSLPIPMPSLQPPSHAHRGSTSSIDTSVSSLRTPDTEQHFPLTLPPLHLPPIPTSPPRENASPHFPFQSTGFTPKAQRWESDPNFPPFSTPSSFPSSPSKHRLPSVSQLLRMEGVDDDSYIHGRGEEEAVRLPPIVAALTDDGVLGHTREGRRGEIPIDPFLLGNGVPSGTYNSGSAQREYFVDDEVFAPSCDASPSRPVATKPRTNPVPSIMVSGAAYTHSRPPPLDLSRISTLHPGGSIPLTPSSVSPLSSDRSNMPTGSSASFDVAKGDVVCGSEKNAEGKRKAKGKRKQLEHDQNVGYQDMAVSPGRKRRSGR